jgi:hypothetical protein
MSGCSSILGSVIFFSLIASGDDRADKSDIFEFVCENEEELLKAIDEGNFSAFENQGFIQTIDTNDTVVDFSCGGAGIGSSTSYVGFYYTANNDMTAVWCAPPPDTPLIPSGDGFSWPETQGDNWYYTQHICGNFYYYEASF